jgi:hypothetical protein
MVNHAGGDSGMDDDGASVIPSDREVVDKGRGIAMSPRVSSPSRLHPCSGDRRRLERQQAPASFGSHWCVIVVSLVCT